MGQAGHVPGPIHAIFIDRQGKTGLPSVLRMPGKANCTLRATHRFRVGRIIVPVLLLCAASLFARPPRNQKHELRHEIDQLEEAWRTALLKGDTATLSSLMADDYMAITPSGMLQTKEESLAIIRAGKFHIATLDFFDRKVRFYSGTAVVTSLANVQATTPEGNLSGGYRYTRVYVRDAQGAWKIVSFEASRIIQPGEHK